MTKFFTFFLLFQSWYYVAKSETELVQPYNLLQETSILVLPFNFSNLSESTAKSFANQMSSILTNNQNLKIYDPILLTDKYPNEILKSACNNLHCGLNLAKELAANYILVTQISFNNPNYDIITKLVNAANQEIVLDEQIISTSQGLEENFLAISQKIVDITPKWGRIIAADDQRGVINLGSDNRINFGSRVIIYHPVSTIHDDQNYPQIIESFPIAIIEIDNVSEKSSSGRFLFSAIKTDIGDRGLIYGDKNKQLTASLQARKLIDQYRERPIREFAKSSIESEIVSEKIINYDKIDWIKQVRAAESSREFYRWMTVGIGSGLAILFAANVKQYGYYLVGAAVGGYSLYKFQQARNSWQVLVDEGKFKGYLDPQWLPSSQINSNTATPKIMLLSYNLNF